MNSEAIVASLLDAGAVLSVCDEKLMIHATSALPNELLIILRRDRSEIIERWQERAAIREFDGEFHRADAESLASQDLLSLDSISRS